MPPSRVQELLDAMAARALAALHLPAGVAGLETTGTVGGIRAGLRPADGEPACRAGEVVILTSGTSGFPSGCVFGLDALLRNAARHADAVGQRAADVVLVNLPLHFSYALVAQALATLLRGGRLVVSGPPFHAPSYVRAVAERGATVSSLTPVTVRTLLSRHAVFPASLRVLTVGGDALGAEHVAELLARRPGGELYLTYGLTQAGPRVSTLAAHREPSRRHRSVGLPLPGTQVWLESVPDGSGEQQLLVASDTVMRRRIGRLEGRPPDWRSPGVIATGDFFEQDADGYLYFRGRMSDFIVRGGEKISLASVRRVAAVLPGVLGVRTQAVAREDGEHDFDLVLTAAAPHPTADEYRVHLGGVLRRTEVPRHLHVVEEGAAGPEYK
jgi:acyl-CoA synthetase (AMP-forming)/AMP-acid ligase II